MSHRKIQAAISEYAAAYSTLQTWQETSPWIPTGDQKTGSIGEYYAYLYLLKKHGPDSLSFGGHSEKGWDIQIESNPICRVQVKTVSEFSKTRTISPIHKGWHSLHLLFLDRDLYPRGFWIVDDHSMFDGKESVHGAKCRHPANPRTGSAYISFGENRVDELWDAIDHFQRASDA